MKAWRIQICFPAAVFLSLPGLGAYCAISFHLLGLERTISVSKRWPMVNSPDAKLLFSTFLSHSTTRREAGELLECERLLPMELSLDQVQNWLRFCRNARCFMGSCSPLPWLFYPSLVLCLTSLLVELSVNSGVWNEKQNLTQRVVTVPGWKENVMILLHQTSRQTCACISMLLPLDVKCRKISMDSQLSAIEMRDEVANIWWGLGRRDGCLTLTQVVRVLPVFGEVLCAVDWQVAALLRTLWECRDFLASVALFLDLDGGSYKRRC